MDPSVLCVLDPEVDDAIRQGRPLPERDIDPETFTVTLPLEFAGTGVQKLASYLDPARAVRAAGAVANTGDLFPASPASRRYTVFSAQTVLTRANTKAFAGKISGSLKKQVSRSVDYGVVCAVDRGAPAWDQIRPALEGARDPSAFASASDIGSSTVHVLSLQGKLLVSASAEAAFDFNWLRELAAGRIRGDIGLSVGGGAQAAIEMTLSGSFVATVGLDERCWLRLRVHKQNRSDFRLPGSLRLAAQMEIPRKEAVLDLAAAFAGVHHLQWLKDLAGKVSTGVPEWLEKQLRVPAETVARFFARWNAIEARAAEAIWNAAAAATDLEGIALWAGRIANELRDAGSFNAAVGNALESDPRFPQSAAALWMEAVAGSLAAAAIDSSAFARLQTAAEAASQFLSEKGLAEALASLRRYATAEIGLGRVEQALESFESWSLLDAWLRQQVQELCGRVDSLLDLRRVGGYLRTLSDVAARVYERAAAALERKAAAEVSYSYESAAEETALIDCSFPFTAEGLALYRQALGGDFREVIAAGRQGSLVLRRGALTHSVRRRVRLELRLPFIGRKSLDSMWQTLAQVEIRPEADGRLLAYSVEASEEFRKNDLYRSAFAFSGGLQIGGSVHSEDAFALSWTSVRRVRCDRARQSMKALLGAYGFSDAPGLWVAAQPKGAIMEATLSLSVPGSYASAWLTTPAEKEAAYFPAFSAMSVAVQQAMRRWLPWVYFEDLDRYGNLAAAMPLVVYQATLPCSGEPKDHFTYDFMDSGFPTLHRPSTEQRLAGELSRVEALLIAAGKERTAEYYERREAGAILQRVARFPHQYRSLLAADAFLVDALVTLAARGRAFRSTAEKNPVRAVSLLSQFAGRFVNAFHGRLRRLYGGEDFACFGPLLLLEATAALHNAVVAPAGVAAILRLSACTPGAASEQTFVNPAFRP